MAATEHYGLQKPDEARFASDEFVSLQLTLDQIDAIMWALQQAADSKAALEHDHTIAQVLGLSSALNGLMPANTTFALDDLTDVDGAALAANGYVLVKTSLGWIPASPAAAIGAHQHALTDITGVTPFARTLLDDADAATMRSTLGIAWEPIGSEINAGGLSVLAFSLPADYSAFHLEFTNVNMSDAMNIAVRTSTNGGASYSEGATDYRYIVNSAAQAGLSVGYSAGIGQMYLTGAAAAAGTRGVGAYLIDPGSGSIHPTFIGQSVVVAADGADRVYQFAARRNATARINAFAVFCPSGTFLTGKFRLLGRR